MKKQAECCAIPKLSSIILVKWDEHSPFLQMYWSTELFFPPFFSSSPPSPMSEFYISLFLMMKSCCWFMIFTLVWTVQWEHKRKVHKFYAFVMNFFWKFMVLKPIRLTTISFFTGYRFASVAWEEGEVIVIIRYIGIFIGEPKKKDFLANNGQISIFYIQT